MTGQEPAVVLVAGGTMLRCDDDGSIIPGRQAAGLFIRDARALCERRIIVDGRTLHASGRVEGRSSRRLALLPATGRGEAPELIAFLTQTVDADGLHEELVLRDASGRARTVEVSVEVATDAADPFALRSDRRRFDRSDGRLTARPSDDGVGVDFAYARSDYRISFRVETEPAPRRVLIGDGEALLARATLDIAVPLAADGTARLTMRTRTLALADRPAGAGPRMRETPQRFTAMPVQELRSRALQDLDALRMPAPGLPAENVIGAGVPWFLTLFGRDSLLSAMLAAPDVSDLLAPVLRALAAHQATATDAARVAEPGKIPHELRIDELAALGEVPYGRYYGSVDSTPLFLIALGRAPRELAAELEPHARAAVAWLRGPGGLDAQGFLRYTPDTGGLIHQGWKDSFDAVAHADGTPAEGPIALCEAQGYAWRALAETARLARTVWGDASWAAELEQAADALRGRFREDFWSERLGVPVLALDGGGAQVDVVASNLGHVLWSGILEHDEAAQLVRRLMQPDMFSGWGLRTLAEGTARYSPLSYHNGSVWPHDTAIAAVGMAENGFGTEASVLGRAVLDAAAALGGTLPELFGGVGRSDFPVPVAYPYAAQPQAWAAAAVLAAARLA